MGTWLPLMREATRRSELAAAPYPVLHRSDRPKFGQLTPVHRLQRGVAISARSANIEAAGVCWITAMGPRDICCSISASKALSYEMKDGYPEYTDLIFRNPEKLAPSSAGIRHVYPGKLLRPVRAGCPLYGADYSLPEQQEAVRLWSNTDTDAHMLHAIADDSEKEQRTRRYPAIMQDVSTLVDEMSLKFILGIEPLEGFDAYVGALKSLGIDRAAAIQQTAFDRFKQPIADG